MVEKLTLQHKYIYIYTYIYIYIRVCVCISFRRGVCHPKSSEKKSFFNKVCVEKATQFFAETIIRFIGVVLVLICCQK